MTVEEARRRFTAARVARLATVDAAGFPHLVPVTFAVAGERIVFAVDAKPKTSTDLRRLRNIRQTGRACLLVDHYDDGDWSQLWWVRADGTASIAADEPRRSALAEPLRDKYAQYRVRPPGGPVVEITVTGWRGWAAGGTIG